MGLFVARTGSELHLLAQWPAFRYEPGVHHSGNGILQVPHLLPPGIRPRRWRAICRDRSSHLPPELYPFAAISILINPWIQKLYCVSPRHILFAMNAGPAKMPTVNHSYEDS